MIFTFIQMHLGLSMGFNKHGGCHTLQVFRPPLPRSQKKRRLQLQRSHPHFRARVYWVSAPLDQSPPAQSSPPAVYLGTALLSATHPPQIVQEVLFPPQWLLEKYVHYSTKISVLGELKLTCSQLHFVFVSGVEL